jgi:ATP-dependent Clp protease ATP-binding subunit ClpC
MGSANLVDWEAYRGIVAGEMSKKAPLDDVQLATNIKARVIGQDKVADQIANQLKRRSAQLKPERPLGVFCFAGPPGVGKTYFAKVLSKNLYEGKGRLHHVDMTQMAQAHAKSALIGSPPGYVGGSGTLTSALLEDPKYVVLLDEFEKAHDEVHKIFLTAWNDGFITDAHTGKRVSTTQAVFILTTNAVQEKLVEIEHNYSNDPDTRDRSIHQALKQAGFAPEVLSRIDYIFVFEPLDQESLARVAALELDQLANSYGLTLTRLDVQYLFNLVTKSSAFQGGGIRELSRVIDRQFGDQFIDAQQRGAKKVRISQVNGKGTVEIDSE